MSRLRSRDLFPSEEPVRPPGELIGRRSDVDELASGLADGLHQIVAAPRRTGKSTGLRGDDRGPQAAPVLRGDRQLVQIHRRGCARRGACIGGAGQSVCAQAVGGACTQARCGGSVGPLADRDAAPEVRARRCGGDCTRAGWMQRPCQGRAARAWASSPWATASRRFPRKRSPGSAPVDLPPTRSQAAISSTRSLFHRIEREIQTTKRSFLNPRIAFTVPTPQLARSALQHIDYRQRDCCRGPKCCRWVYVLTGEEVVLRALPDAL